MYNHVIECYFYYILITVKANQSRIKTLNICKWRTLTFDLSMNIIHEANRMQMPEVGTRRNENRVHLII